MSDISPQKVSFSLVINLNISQVEVISLSFNKFEQTRLNKNVSFDRIQQKHFDPNILQVQLDTLLPQLILIPPLLFLTDIHEILRLDIFIDDFDLRFGPLKHDHVQVRINLNRNPNLVVILSIHKSNQSRKLPPCLLLLTFEQICQLYHVQHLTSSVRKLSQHYALVFQLLPVVVILLTTHAPELSLLLVFDIVM